MVQLALAKTVSISEVSGSIYIDIVIIYIELKTTMTGQIQILYIDVKYTDTRLVWSWGVGGGEFSLMSQTPLLSRKMMMNFFFFYSMPRVIVLTVLGKKKGVAKNRKKKKK